MQQSFREKISRLHQNFAQGLAKLSGPQMGVMIITHHRKLLEYNIPQYTHVMLAGRIVETGDAKLAHELYSNGYAGVRERHPEEAAEEDAVKQPKIAAGV